MEEQFIAHVVYRRNKKNGQSVAQPRKDEWQSLNEMSLSVIGKPEARKQVT